MNFMRGESPAHEYIGKVNVRMRNQGQLLKVSCTVLFCLFTFFYIYTYQCDLISYGQMVLSEGKTHFDRTIGSLLLTVALYMVQLFVNGLVRPHDRFVALTFFPSLLILTFITDIPKDIDRSFSLGDWMWVGPLLLLLFSFLVWLLRQWSVRWQPSNTSFFHDLWINLSIMVLMFFLVCCVSNSDELFHRQLRMERFAINGDYEDVMDEMAEVETPDDHLTLLTAFALSQESLLGEHFFEYPVGQGSEIIDPDNSSSRTYLIPKEVMSHAYGHPFWKDDYELTRLLMDRRLMDFAKKVKTCYSDSTMPKHFREAMAVFRDSKEAELLKQQEEAALREEMEKAKKERRKVKGKKAKKKEIIIHPADSIMLVRYETYQLLLQSSKDKRVVYNLSRKYYHDTYWHYYHFPIKKEAP